MNDRLSGVLSRLNEAMEQNAVIQADWRRGRFIRSQQLQREAGLRFRERNPVRHRAIRIAASARRRARIGATDPGEALAIVDKISHATQCHHCGREFGPDRQKTCDHVKPLSKCGQHIADNVVASCRQCNSRKNAHYPWRRHAWMP